MPYRLLRADSRLSVGDPGSGNLLVEGGSIYDAVMQVDSDANPDYTPCTAAWLFGHSWTTYKQKVVDDNPQSTPGDPAAYSFGLQ